MDPTCHILYLIFLLGVDLIPFTPPVHPYLEFWIPLCTERSSPGRWRGPWRRHGAQLEARYRELQASGTTRDGDEAGRRGKGERDRTDLAAIIAGAEELPRGGERATEQGESAVRVVGERARRRGAPRGAGGRAAAGALLALRPAELSSASQLQPAAQPHEGARSRSFGRRRGPAEVFELAVPAGGVRRVRSSLLRPWLPLPPP
jgi:hypothetical protein